MYESRRVRNLRKVTGKARYPFYIVTLVFLRPELAQDPARNGFCSYLFISENVYAYMIIRAHSARYRNIMAGIFEKLFIRLI